MIGKLNAIGKPTSIDKPASRRLAPAALAPLPLIAAIVAALGLGMTSDAKSDAVSDTMSGALAQQLPANTSIVCLDQNDDCKVRIIRLPDGLPGQVLKFEFCQEGDCDRAHREHWRTQFIVPPPGEVCHNTDINEALHWLEQNAHGWLLAGWGCVSGKQIPV